MKHQYDEMGPNERALAKAKERVARGAVGFSRPEHGRSITKEARRERAMRSERATDAFGRPLGESTLSRVARRGQGAKNQVRGYGRGQVGG